MDVVWGDYLMVAEVVVEDDVVVWGGGALLENCDQNNINSTYSCCFG